MHPGKILSGTSPKAHLPQTISHRADTERVHRVPPFAGTVAALLMDGPTPRRSHHGPKGLRLGARSDRPPTPASPASGPHGGRIRATQGWQQATYWFDQGHSLQSSFVYFPPPTRALTHAGLASTLAHPGSAGLYVIRTPVISP